MAAAALTVFRCTHVHDEGYTVILIPALNHLPHTIAHWHVPCLLHTCCYAGNVQLNRELLGFILPGASTDSRPFITLRAVLARCVCLIFLFPCYNCDTLYICYLSASMHVPEIGLDASCRLCCFHQCSKGCNTKAILSMAILTSTLWT